MLRGKWAPLSDSPQDKRTPGRRALLSGGVQVSFVVEVDVREASAASGNAYSVTGPATDDAWASSSAALDEATRLFQDLTNELLAATAVAASGDSPWGQVSTALLVGESSGVRRRALAVAAPSTSSLSAERAADSLLEQPDTKAY